ncbi:hypothetical protein ACFLXE_01545 [Chloroflexota bacterium]
MNITEGENRKHLSQEDLEQIQTCVAFDIPYYRLIDDREHRHGLGLGLALSKTLV